MRLVLQTENRSEKFGCFVRLVLQTVRLVLQLVRFVLQAVRLVLQGLSTRVQLRLALVSPRKICKRKRTPYFVQISISDFVKENARIQR